LVESSGEENPPITTLFSDRFYLIHEGFYSAFIHVVFKHSVEFKGRAYNRPVGSTEQVFQVACVGLTGKATKQAGYDVVEGSAPLSMNPFGVIISQTERIIEVVADKKYGEALGMHFIGQGACEMAGQAVLSIQMEATLEELTRATFPHPTLSESLAEAARECLGRPIYLP